VAKKGWARKRNAPYQRGFSSHLLHFIDQYLFFKSFSRQVHLDNADEVADHCLIFYLVAVDSKPFLKNKLRPSMKKIMLQRNALTGVARIIFKRSTLVLMMDVYVCSKNTYLAKWATKVRWKMVLV
jgi:hypothetical protein